MPNRDFKFYRENEAEAMRSLGLEPTPNSGSGWKVKEDGQSEHIICQHKCTDKTTISISQKDIRVLEKHAAEVHKTPLFAIQFNNTGEMWIMAKPEDFIYVADNIRGAVSPAVNGVMNSLFSTMEDVDEQKPKKVIKSSNKAREKLLKEKEEIVKQWQSKKRGWK